MVLMAVVTMTIVKVTSSVLSVLYTPSSVDGRRGTSRFVGDNDDDGVRLCGPSCRQWQFQPTRRPRMAFSSLRLSSSQSSRSLRIVGG